jgi:hypothetical protein
LNCWQPPERHTADINVKGPHGQLEAAYHRADKAINQIVELLAAA